jgi:hypothetical protein
MHWMSSYIVIYWEAKVSALDFSFLGINQGLVHQAQAAPLALSLVA